MNHKKTQKTLKI